jgi:hypothetical protein
MVRIILFILLGSLLLQCSNTVQKSSNDQQTTIPQKSIPMKTPSALSCKLSEPALQQRKTGIIGELKKLITGKKELPDGYAFKFPGTDEVLDLLTGFVKSERQCCDFFSFRIHVANQHTIWFDITGPAGAKEFITTEMEL